MLLIHPSIGCWERRRENQPPTLLMLLRGIIADSSITPVNACLISNSSVALDYMTAQQPPDSVSTELATMQIVGAGEAHVVVRMDRPSCQQCPRQMVP